MSIMHTPQRLEDGAETFTFDQARTIARNLYEAYRQEHGYELFVMDALSEPKLFRGVLSLMKLVETAVDTIEQIELVKEEGDVSSQE